MGLVTGEKDRKTTIYIYPQSPASKHEEILVNIRGPYNTFGRARVTISGLPRRPPRRNSLYEECKKLAFSTTTQSNFFFGYFKKGNLGESIPIKIITERDRAKCIFIPRHTGIYELCLTTNGYHLRGSPYVVRIVENSTGVVESLENLDNGDNKKNRPVLRRTKSKVIDFVCEQMSYEEYIESVEKQKELFRGVSDESNCSSIDEFSRSIAVIQENIDKNNSKEKKLKKMKSLDEVVNVIVKRDKQNLLNKRYSYPIRAFEIYRNGEMFFEENDNHMKKEVENGEDLFDNRGFGCKINEKEGSINKAIQERNCGNICEESEKRRREEKESEERRHERKESKEERRKRKESKEERRERKESKEERRERKENNEERRERKESKEEKRERKISESRRCEKKISEELRKENNICENIEGNKIEEQKNNEREIKEIKINQKNYDKNENKRNEESHVVSEPNVSKITSIEVKASKEKTNKEKANKEKSTKEEKSVKEEQSKKDYCSLSVKQRSLLLQKRIDECSRNYPQIREDSKEDKEKSSTNSFCPDLLTLKDFSKTNPIKTNLFIITPSKRRILRFSEEKTNENLSFSRSSPDLVECHRKSSVVMKIRKSFETLSINSSSQIFLENIANEVRKEKRDDVSPFDNENIKETEIVKINDIEKNIENFENSKVKDKKLMKGKSLLNCEYNKNINKQTLTNENLLIAKKIEVVETRVNGVKIINNENFINDEKLKNEEKAKSRKISVESDISSLKSDQSLDDSDSLSSSMSILNYLPCLKQNNRKFSLNSNYSDRNSNETLLEKTVSVPNLKVLQSKEIFLQTKAVLKEKQCKSEENIHDKTVDKKRKLSETFKERKYFWDSLCEGNLNLCDIDSVDLDRSSMKEKKIQNFKYKKVDALSNEESFLKGVNVFCGDKKNYKVKETVVKFNKNEF